MRGTSLLDRTCQCFFNRQGSHTTLQTWLGDTDFMSPVGQAHGSVVQGQPSVMTRVVRLWGLCGPDAIRWPAMAQAFFAFPATIVSIIMAALNRVPLRWTGAHIIVEGLKALIPSPAHIFPYLIFWHASTQSMRPYASRVDLRNPTPTALARMFDQRITGDHSTRPTKTFTVPIADRSVAHVAKAKHGPSTTYASSQIFVLPKTWHGRQPPERLNWSRMGKPRRAAATSIGMLAFGSGSLAAPMSLA